MPAGFVFSTSLAYQRLVLSVLPARTHTDMQACMWNVARALSHARTHIPSPTTSSHGRTHTFPPAAPGFAAIMASTYKAYLGEGLGPLEWIKRFQIPHPGRVVGRIVLHATMPQVLGWVLGGYNDRLEAARPSSCRVEDKLKVCVRSTSVCVCVFSAHSGKEVPLWARVLLSCEPDRDTVLVPTAQQEDATCMCAAELLLNTRRTCVTRVGA